jgi:hypothetical protein
MCSDACAKPTPTATQPAFESYEPIRAMAHVVQDCAHVVVAHLVPYRELSETGISTDVATPLDECPGDVA